MILFLDLEKRTTKHSKMKKHLLVFFICLNFYGFSQLDFGFMGKKNSIQINTYSGLNLMHIVDYGFSSSEYDQNGKIIDWFTAMRISASLRYSRLISSNFSIGLEGEFRPIRGVTMSNSSHLSGIEVKFVPRFNMYSVVPVFTLHSKRKSLGFKGRTIGFGIGPTFSTLVEPKNLFDGIGNEVPVTSIENPGLVYGLKLFVESGYSIPLNANFFLNLKYRIALNLVFVGNEYYLDTDSSIYFRQNEVKRSLRRKAIGSIMDLNVGVLYQF